MGTPEASDAADDKNHWRTDPTICEFCTHPEGCDKCRNYTGISDQSQERRPSLQRQREELNAS